MIALSMTLAAALAGGPAPAPPADPAAATRAQAQSALILGAGAALASVDAIWGWHDPGSYRAFWGDRRDQGPVERLTPVLAAPLAASAGALHLSALGRDQGLEVRLPGWYWLGLLPTITTVRAMSAGEAGDPIRPVDRRAVVASTAASFAWYAAATAWLSWRLRESSPDAPPPWAVRAVAPAPRPARLAAAEQRQRSALLLGAGAAATAGLAAWMWGDPRGYQRFGLGEDPGPAIDPTPLLAPFAAPPMAAASGVMYLRATAAARGAEARVPAWYWLGLAPLVTSYRAMAAADPEHGVSATGRRTIVAGTLGSAAWFAGATALLVRRLPEGPAAGPGAGGELSLEPLTIRAPRGAVTGLAVSGSF